jgi:hypothetical protein
MPPSKSSSRHHRFVLFTGIALLLAGWALYIVAAVVVVQNDEGQSNPKCQQLLAYEWLGPAFVCVVSFALLYMAPSRRAYLGEDDVYEQGVNRLMGVMMFVAFIGCAPALALIITQCMQPYSMMVKVGGGGGEVRFESAPTPVAESVPNPEPRGLFKPSPSPAPIKQRITVYPDFLRGGLLLGQLGLTVLGQIILFDYFTRDTGHGAGGDDF